MWNCPDIGITGSGDVRKILIVCLILNSEFNKTFNEVVNTSFRNRVFRDRKNKRNKNEKSYTHAGAGSIGGGLTGDVVLV